MPIIFFSEQDEASKSIFRSLTERHGFREHGVVQGKKAWVKDGVLLVGLEERAVYLEEIPFSSDYFIFASRHSGEGGPCLTVHCPGNWTDKAELGGKPRQVSTAPALKMKQAIRELSEASKKIGWPVFMEATHHGPSIDTPCFFMEIGSSGKEWGNAEAADAVAAAMCKVVFEDPPQLPAVFGVGGGHYCPKFTALQQKAGCAVGHVLPKYCVGEIDLGSFAQGIEKTVPRPEKAVLDWKGLNSEQRKKIITFCEKTGIGFEKA